MAELIKVTIQLYQEALLEAIRSFTRCWIISVAVVLFAGAMIAAATVVGALGILGGLFLGVLNALVIGATLSLIEEAVKRPRRLALRDIGGSFGQYFWDVIGVGFALWLPVMVLDQGTASNPYGPFLASAVFFLLFILLNPAPEVIYQIRHDSPLDVLKESYYFIVENWIEWFLPVAVVLAPLGVHFFFQVTTRVGRVAGLNFFELVLVPGTILSSWLTYVGLSPGLSWGLAVVLTPPLAVFVMMFRGHLFAALHGSSRRHRVFKARSMAKD